jgi:hypothetical protein
MSGVENKIDEILKRLSVLETNVSEYKSMIDTIIITNTTLVQEVANQINTKLDILCNIESLSNNNKSSVKNTAKPLTKLAFFKNQLKNNLNVYLNELYTENDIKELYENPKVKESKTELSKKTKIIELLYAKITKNNKEKDAILKNIYEDYKIKFEKEQETNDDEETKSEE